LDWSGDAATDGGAAWLDIGLAVMLFEGRAGAAPNADGAVPGHSAASGARID